MPSDFAATVTSQASTPASRGSTTNEGGAWAMPLEACSTIPRASFAVSVGVVETVSPG